MKAILRIAFLAMFGVTAAAQSNNPNQVRERGQVPVREHVRVGQGKVSTAKTLSGVLVDASCPDRSAENLRLPPPPSPAQPAENSASRSVSAAGVTVDSKTAESERADAVAKQTPDLRTRQNDAGCAVTGATVTFAVLLDDGRLLNLDEGGNTMAAQAVNTSPAGKAMLEGKGSPFKPRVTLSGNAERDRIIVQKIVKLEPPR